MFMRRRLFRKPLIALVLCAVLVLVTLLSSPATPVQPPAPKMPLNVADGGNTHRVTVPVSAAIDVRLHDPVANNARAESIDAGANANASAKRRYRPVADRERNTAPKANVTNPARDATDASDPYRHELPLVVWRDASETRFEGRPTMDDRNASFHVLTQAPPSTPIHCGFLAPSLWDDIRRQTMHMDCETVVATAMFGAQDRILGDCNQRVKQVCYVAFIDVVTQTWWEQQERAGNHSYSTGLSLWTTIVLPPEGRRAFPETPRLEGKIPKLLQHRLFPQATTLLWMDGKLALRTSVEAVVGALLYPTHDAQMLWGMASHPASEWQRHAIDDAHGEALHILNRPVPLDRADTVHSQMHQYYDVEGYPRHDGLAEGAFFVRRNTPETRHLSCVWFNEVMRYSSRDQLSFNYAAHVTRIKPRLNIVRYGALNRIRCEMGHIFRRGVAHVDALAARETIPPDAVEVHSRATKTCECVQ